MGTLDPRGYPLTGCTAVAARDAYVDACELFHGYYADPVARIDEALAQDPDFAMALCLKGGIFATATERALEPELRAIVERLRAIEARCDSRERGHIEALGAWLDGDFERAVETWGAVLFEYPRDLLALQFAHLGDFLLGRSTMLRDRPARVLCQWGSDIPGLGYVHGMHAFGLEESGHYDAAQEAGLRALELNARDPWAVHAVAHVNEMQGRIADGIDWLESRSGDWATGNMFAFHNWWHLALFHLDRADFASALRLYDQGVRPAPSEVALEMLDASALLWRLRLREVDVGQRWDELARAWENKIDDGYYAFNDAHAMMAFAATGRAESARRLLAAMRSACERSDTNAAMTRVVGLPLANALLAFSEARYDEALDALLPVLPVAHCFGGSHAQRDLLSLTAIESAIHARRTGAARALVSQRLAAKPQSQHNQELAARVGLARLH